MSALTSPLHHGTKAAIDNITTSYKQQHGNILDRTGNSELPSLKNMRSASHSPNPQMNF